MKSSDRPADGTWQVTLRMLRRFLPGEVCGLVLGLGLIMVATAVGLLQPWPLKIAVDSVAGSLPASAPVQHWAGPILAHLPGGPRVALLIFVCLAVLGIEIFLAAFRVASIYILNAVALRLVCRVRCALFDHIQRQSLAFHDARKVGDSLYRITWDSYCIQSIFSAVVVPAITATLTLVGIAVMLFNRAGALVWAALAVIVPLMVLVRRLDRPMTEQAQRVHEQESGVSARVQEALVGIRAVQAFGREDFENERFRARAGASLVANLRLTVLQSVAQAVVGLVLAAGTGAVIWFCTNAILAGRLTTGDLVLIVAYAAMLFKPIETLAYTAASAQSAAAGARRVLSVLETASDVTDSPTARPLPGRAAGAIAFAGVNFAFRSDRPVLRDVNLSIEPQSTVALVGLSGAGKTTLASLVPRFYDPGSGRVTVDEHDVRTLTLQSLRQNIALVTQDPVLFGTSVRDNLIYGRPDATPAQIEAAACMAGAHDFITALPEGYDTLMAERGVTFSGGQRQRLSIARAFLKDAPIVILDEPTSALDAETEQQLMQAFARLRQGRTTLIIAHRLSTIRSANRIIVLHEGRVVEDGTHEELLTAGGPYARLHQIQVGRFTPVENEPVAITPA